MAVNGVLRICGPCSGVGSAVLDGSEAWVGGAGGTFGYGTDNRRGPGL